MPLQRQQAWCLERFDDPVSRLRRWNQHLAGEVHRLMMVGVNLRNVSHEPTYEGVGCGFHAMAQCGVRAVVSRIQMILESGGGQVLDESASSCDDQQLGSPAHAKHPST